MKLALGTVQFGQDYGVNNHDGQVPFSEVQKILDYAKNHGVDTLDTAVGYGNSEQILGEIGVEQFHVITKTISLKSGVDNVIRNFNESLITLNVAQVYGLLIHNINDVESKYFSDLYLKLKYLKEAGVVNKIGFSTYMPSQVDFLLNNFDFDLIQVPFNVFDIRLIEGGQFKKLKERGVEIHARSIFLQGLLLNFNNLPDYFSTWDLQFKEYQEVVKENALSLLEYALNFALNNPFLDKIIVGVNDLSQLSDILKASKYYNNLSAFKIDDVNLLNPSLWKH